MWWTTIPATSPAPGTHAHPWRPCDFNASQDRSGGHGRRSFSWCCRHAGASVVCLAAARGENPTPAPVSSPLPALAPFKDPDAATLAFLQKRVAADPDDVTAQNRLASECLRRLRLSGDLAWLDRAAEAARRSLASVPASQNPAGLAAQAKVQFESHRFLDAVATLRLMRQYAEDKPYTLALLGDALLEAGDYDAAADAYRDLRRLIGGQRRAQRPGRGTAFRQDGLAPW